MRVLHTVLCLWVIAGCSPEVTQVPATSIMVRIEADGDVREVLKALRVRTRSQRDGLWVTRADTFYDESDLRWPVDIVVTPVAGQTSARTFEVVVDATSGGSPESQVLAQARLLTTFAPQESRIVFVQLSSCGAAPESAVCEQDAACAGLACRTCLDGTCQETPLVQAEPTANFEPVDAGVSPATADAGGIPVVMAENGETVDDEMPEAQAPASDGMSVAPTGCSDGSERTPEGDCVDIDECVRGLHDCDDSPPACVNVDGAGYLCACPMGYAGEGIGEDGCSDLDECALGSHACGSLTECSNTPGGYTCGDCPPGYLEAADGTCQDINECQAANNGGCDTTPFARCINQVGSANTCECPAGYLGNGVGSEGCTDQLECSKDNGGCHPMARCNEQVGAAPTCSCPSGYEGSGQGANGCTKLGPMPRIPAISGTCPEFRTGTATIGGLSGIELQVGPRGDGKGALLFYWHSTGSVAGEVSMLPSDVRADILDAGGIIVAFAGSSGSGNDCSGTGTFSQGDLDIADLIVACAVRDHGIDPSRIYTTGCSSGGLQAGCMAVTRSSYMAAAATNSGGTLMPQSFEDPNHVPAVMTMHGAPGNDVVIVDYAEASAALGKQITNAGGFAVDCNHGGGHCGADADLQRAAWQFMRDHPFGVEPEPYTTLPASFPSYCSIQ